MTYEHWLLLFTVVFSACETAVTIYLYRRLKKKLDAERRKLETTIAEYQTATEQLKLFKGAI